MSGEGKGVVGGRSKEVVGNADELETELFFHNKITNAMTQQEKINSILAEFQQGERVTFYYEGQWYWGMVKSCTSKVSSPHTLVVEILASIHEESSTHPYSFMFLKGRRVHCSGQTSEIDAHMNRVIIKGWELVQNLLHF